MGTWIQSTTEHGVQLTNLDKFAAVRAKTQGEHTVRVYVFGETEGGREYKICDIGESPKADGAKLGNLVATAHAVIGEIANIVDATPEGDINIKGDRTPYTGKVVITAKLPITDFAQLNEPPPAEFAESVNVIHMAMDPTAAPPPIGAKSVNDPTVKADAKADKK